MLIIILLHYIVWVTGCLNISGSYWRVLARSWTRRIVLTTAGQSSQDYSGPRNTGGTLGPGLAWWQPVVQYWPLVTLTNCSYEIRDMRYEIWWEIIRDMRDNTAAPDLAVVLLWYCWAPELTGRLLNVGGKPGLPSSQLSSARAGSELLNLLLTFR